MSQLRGYQFHKATLSVSVLDKLIRKRENLIRVAPTVRRDVPDQLVVTSWILAASAYARA